MKNVERACILISRDNGGINRHRTEDQVQRELQKFLASVPYRDKLPAIDVWLETLNAVNFETVCCGEMHDVDALMETAPQCANQLLNDWFENC